MQATMVIVLLWLVFAVTHMIPSSLTLRAKIVARIGEPAFLGAYSLVSLAVFIPLQFHYVDAPARHPGCRHVDVTLAC